MTERVGYSAGFIRFVLVPLHREAYEAAYLDQSPASINELARLHREFRTLPPRHNCTCVCPNVQRGWRACVECRRLRDAEVRAETPAEIGRTRAVEAPMPMPLLLDLERAMHVLGTRTEPYRIARWLSGGN